jgi:hypothetical protein
VDQGSVDKPANPAGLPDEGIDKEMLVCRLSQWMLGAMHGLAINKGVHRHFKRVGRENLEIDLIVILPVNGPDISEKRRIQAASLIGSKTCFVCSVTKSPAGLDFTATVLVRFRYIEKEI